MVKKVFKKEKQNISFELEKIIISKDSFLTEKVTFSILHTETNNLDRLLYIVIKDEHSNQRMGVAKVKRRSDVRGGGKKPWKQKGTGRARQGSIRSVQWPGGGKAFGPNGRIYARKINSKLYSKCFRALILDKIEKNELFILENSCTKTKIVFNFLNNFVSEKDKKKCFVLKTKDLSLSNFPKENNKIVFLENLLLRHILYNKFVFFDKVSFLEILKKYEK